MAHSIRARLSRLEQRRLPPRSAGDLGGLVLGLESELTAILRDPHAPDREAAAELLRYGPQSTERLSALSNQALELVERLLAERLGIVLP